MKFWSEVAAVRGGCSAQSESIRRSVETRLRSLEQKERQNRALLQPAEQKRARLVDDLERSRGSESQACEVCNTVLSF